MAKAVLHPMIRTISGRVGSLVFYESRGNQYIRRYVIPRNPNTPAQHSQRALFASAVFRWQHISESAKERWKTKARNIPMSGYNLFISTYLFENDSSQDTEPFCNSSYQLRSHSVFDSIPTHNNSEMHKKSVLEGNGGP